MDFEQLQRIDLLSKQLKENGLASSFEEATEKATAMINKTEDNNQQETADDKLEILQQRYQFKLNTLDQKYSEQVEALQKTVSSLNAELIEMKRKMVQMQQRPRQEVQSTLTKQEEQKPEAKKDFNDVSPDTKREELNPDDFSVEKYFYFGQK